MHVEVLEAIVENLLQHIQIIQAFCSKHPGCTIAHSSLLRDFNFMETKFFRKGLNVWSMPMGRSTSQTPMTERRSPAGIFRGDFDAKLLVAQRQTMGSFTDDSLQVVIVAFTFFP